MYKGDYEAEPFTGRGMQKIRKPVLYHPIPKHVVRFKDEIPFWVVLLIILTLASLYLAAFFLFLRLPRGLKVDEEDRYPGRFIAERAAAHVKNLTDIGDRVAGTTNNEVLAMNLILAEIDKIKQETHTSNLIEVDHQVADGSYYRDKRVYPQLNVYRGVQNIVVKLDKKQKTNSNNYILLNAHIDTVVMSPGESRVVIVAAYKSALSVVGFYLYGLRHSSLPCPLLGASHVASIVLFTIRIRLTMSRCS